MNQFRFRKGSFVLGCGSKRGRSARKREPGTKASGRVLKTENKRMGYLVTRVFGPSACPHLSFCDSDVSTARRACRAAQAGVRDFMNQFRFRKGSFVCKWPWVHG